MHMDMARGATVTSIHGMSYFRVSLFSLSKRCCDVSEASRSFWRTNMSSNLFWRCSGVSQLLPVASWTRLSSNLFWRCSGVSQLLCVASWTRLSSNLFWRCSGVSQLLCVASWTRLSSNLFWRCSGVSQLLCVASWTRLNLFWRCKCFRSFFLPICSRSFQASRAFNDGFLVLDIIAISSDAALVFHSFFV